MRTLVVQNPAAGRQSSRDVLEASVRARPGWELAVTREPGEATRLAAEALGSGFDRVVAAGGDGTINEVVQALAEHPEPARLGVVPLGTANDLSRTLALPSTVEGALELIDRGDDRLIDLFCLEMGDERRWGINVSVGGFGGEVDRNMTEELKEAWGPLAYLIGALEVAGEFEPWYVEIFCDDAPADAAEAVGVIVANARTCAGGRLVAPLADLEDGLLDVVVLEHGTLLELTGLATRLAAGTLFQSSHVRLHRCRSVRVTATPPMWFNVDGELVGDQAASFRCVPKRVRVAVGPAYTREAVTP